MPRLVKAYLLRQTISWGMSQAAIRMKIRKGDAAGLSRWLMEAKVPLPAGFSREALKESARWLTTAEGIDWLAKLPAAWRGSGVLSVSPSIRAQAACACAQGPTHTPSFHRRAAESKVGSGSLKVNAGAMWHMAAKDMYADNDLPTLACRESLQNSVDGIRRRIKQGEIKKGLFEVEWDGAGELTFRDNGIGMSRSTVEEKFLTLGSTGKEGDIDSAGGFGMAKAVILGAAVKGRWRLRSGGYEFRSGEVYGEYNVYSIDNPVRGVEITLWDVSDEWDSSIFKRFLSVEDRIRNVLAFSWTPDVQIRLNGKTVRQPWKKGAGGRPKFDDLDWGEKNTVVLRSHKRDAGTGGGGVWVRLNGLLQFVTPMYSSVSLDLVVDLRSRAKPGMLGGDYPFPPSRDSFRGPARRALQGIMSQLSATQVKQQESKWETILPSSLGGEKASAAYEQSMREAMEDTELFADALRAAAKAQVELAKGPEGKFQETAQDAQGGPRGIDLSTLEDVNSVVDAKSVESLREAVTTMLLQGGIEPDSVRGSLDALDDGSMTEGQATILLTALQETQEKLLIGGAEAGSATLIAGVLSKLGLAVAEQSPNPEAAKRIAEVANPFGSAGAIKISKTDYSKAKARAFKKNAGKWLKHLLIWDLTLRMVSEAIRLELRYMPGFILQDSVRALATQEGSVGSQVIRLVLINPDGLKAAIKGAQGDPRAVAHYLHSLAAHELSHLPFFSRRGDPHHESWAILREDTGFGTSHLLGPLTAMVSKVLKMEPTTLLVRDHHKAVRRLERKAATLTRRIQESRKGKMSPTEARRNAANLQALSGLNSALDAYYRFVVDLGAGVFKPHTRTLQEGLLSHPEAAIETLRTLKR